MDKVRKFDNGLIIKHRRSAVILEVENIEDYSTSRFTFSFNDSEFKDFTEYMEQVANTVWKNFVPKDATSEASDYWEYYDKEYDNNGYLIVKGNSIKVEAPHYSAGRIYQFSKSKLQSFIFDLKKKEVSSCNYADAATGS
ncbi:hypothetical protein ACH0B6_19160 [Solibacillus silvestris]